MTRRRWIADEFTATTAALTGEHANHLVRVLRVRPGQEFDIVAGDTIRRGKATVITEARVEFDLGERLPRVPIPNIVLVLAIFKFDRMELAIEKCTELGVLRIVPLIARRTDAHLASASTKRVERWRRIALQAAEQSRRSTPPEISSPIKLAQAVGFAGILRIVLAEHERQDLLRDVLQRPLPEGEIILAVGPEGGWTDDELKQFREAGWISASLGPTILRAETAAIAATAIVSSNY